jgi:hypothetical protein
MYYIRKAASILWYVAIACIVGCTIYEEYVCAGEDPGYVNGVYCVDMFYYPNFPDNESVTD